MIKNFFAALFLVPMISFAAAAQSFVGETINAAFETVQEGLDLIWPDQLSLEDVNARMGFGFGL